MTRQRREDSFLESTTQEMADIRDREMQLSEPGILAWIGTCLLCQSARRVRHASPSPQLQDDLAYRHMMITEVEVTEIQAPQLQVVEQTERETDVNVDETPTTSSREDAMPGHNRTASPILFLQKHNVSICTNNFN
jgi:hypothetical protein